MHQFEAHSLASVASKEAAVNELVTELVANPGNAQARQKLRELLKFDEQNLSYFLSLYEKKLAGHKEELQIFEAGKSAEGKLTAYPTAIAPAELLSQIPYVQYGSLKSSKEYTDAASSSVVWIKKMQAGTGSSLTRQTYLGRIKKIDPKEVRIGAKGTDLYVDVPDPRAPSKTVSVSLAEAQILQAIHDAQSGKFSGVVLHDLIGPETEESIANLWSKKSLIDPTKTYEQVLKDLKIVQRSSRSSFQSYMPTIDEAGKFSFGRQAPGGHGYFGVDALRAAYRDEMRPKTGKSLVSAVGNGEDLSSTPDAAMVGWMIKKQVPIAMVTTEKTMNDLKGGQIALVKRSDGSTYATIIEQAQAKEAGQQALFEKLGLDVRRGDQVAFFNTNMALFNYDVLTPKIKKLVSEIGEHEFMKIVAPDLISNVKKQKDPDGVVRKYLQLEGAMGSSLLNLDRYWRQHYKEPLVHFINVEKDARTEFFSPIKSAFDYFMQFHSDLFKLDPKSMRLSHQRPGSLPAVSLKDRLTEDKYYADVQHVTHSFQGTSLLDLKSLNVDGQVMLTGVILRGDVRIHNKGTGGFDLSAYLKRHPNLVPHVKGVPVLENVTLEISESGEVRKL
ncbi:MAG: UTP--glucose-1-phosphate uridylyltransferase [Bdellovibrionia bacterium]